LEKDFPVDFVIENWEHATVADIERQVCAYLGVENRDLTPTEART
jgi:hypothetical protein